MPSRSARGKQGELEVICYTLCPKCQGKFFRLPEGNPLFDIECSLCHYQIQVKTEKKPRNAIWGATWLTLKKHIDKGHEIPPLIINWKWHKQNIAYQRIDFIENVLIDNIHQHYSKKRDLWMFWYEKILGLHLVTLYENSMENVEVKTSDVQGNGVFALKSFQKDEVVLIIDDSHVVTDPSKLPIEEKDHCDYLSDGKIVLMQSPEVYINHSCDPNTYVKTIDGQRNVVAMKDIQKGDEVTYDYAINGYYDSSDICHCGSKNCRGTISPNFFKLSKKRQLEYFPYLDEWFKKQFISELKKISNGQNIHR